MDRKIIAYDLGTGGIKASLYTAEGRSLASTFVSYQTYFPGDHMQEQAPDDWWNAIIASTRQLLLKTSTDGRDIAALAISGHSLGVVPVGRGGELLRERTPIWSDKRAAAQAAQFFEKIDYRSWYMDTGNGFPPECYSVFKMMWYRQNEPDMYARIDKVIGTKDYCNYRLTGRLCTDYSYASGSGLFDLGKWEYKQEYVEASGIAPSVLPEILESDAVVGNITHEAAVETGLPTTVKVICGGVDNSCMALGAKGSEGGRVYTSLGSSAWIALVANRPVLDFTHKPYVFAHVIKGMYTSATSIFSAGSSLRWVRDNFCADLLEKEQAGGPDAYEEMTGLAAASPIGAGNVIFNPSLAGGSMIEETPDICGGFGGINLSTGRGDIIRATLEGIALNLRVAFDILKSYHPGIDSMLIAGGGSKSAMWRQIFADVYRTEILKSNVDQDAASLGAAALAAKGAGLWKDYSGLDALHTIESRTAPSETGAAEYDKVLARFKEFAHYMALFGGTIADAGRTGDKA